MGELDNHIRWRQLCEILSVLAITTGIGLVVHGFLISPRNNLEGVVGLILIGCAVVLFIVAVSHAGQLDAEEGRLKEEAGYLISGTRIATLTEVKAPQDVTMFLTSIIKDVEGGSRLLTYDDLLGEMRQALGTHRTREVQDLVLKYTRVDLNSPFFF
jgi:multisubunit Na+/H+ antiporter MnhC subunit